MQGVGFRAQGPGKNICGADRTAGLSTSPAAPVEMTRLGWIGQVLGGEGGAFLGGGGVGEVLAGLGEDGLEGGVVVVGVVVEED